MRLIDADALIYTLAIDPEECPGCPEPEFLEMLSDILETTPEAVVRCEDCVHMIEAYDLDERESFVWCEKWENETDRCGWCCHGKGNTDDC